MAWQQESRLRNVSSLIKSEDLNEDCISKTGNSSSDFSDKTGFIGYSAHWNVLPFKQLPNWLQDNDYLLFGHRPPLGSFKKCFASIFRLHNETVNIWTHGLGCLGFVILGVYFLFGFPVSWIDKAIISLFFIGAILCLGLSSCYHTLSCHSPNVGKLFSKLDYCGIALLILGSFIPWLYYGFYCEHELKKWYIILETTLGLATIIVSLRDKFGEPLYRPFRTFVFLMFGLSAIFPCIHWLARYNRLSYADLRSSFFNLVLMGILYVVGALIYACRMPERFWPGKFDYWLHSHAIFHCFVIAAACVYYFCILNLALFRLTTNICAEVITD